MREKLDLVTLPREAKRPAILRFDPVARPDPALPALGRRQPAAPAPHRRAARSRRDLEGVAGRGRGARRRAARRRRSRSRSTPARLSAVGLTLADVTRRLARGERQPGRRLAHRGQVRVPGPRDQPVRSIPQEIGDVILAARARRRGPRSPTSPPCRRGAKDREVIARVDGERGGRDRGLQGGRRQHRGGRARGQAPRRARSSCRRELKLVDGRRPVALHRERDRRRHRLGAGRAACSRSSCCSRSCATCARR